MDYLSELTESQQAAVTHVDGPMLVLAGPGSGKTRVVTARVAHLLNEGISPHNILALTFTNKAADEMRSRLGQLSPGNPVWMSTFHRFCSQLLRRHARMVGLSENFRIYDTQDSQQALKSVIEESDIPIRRYTPAQIARTISNAKNELATPEQFQSSARHPLEVVAAEVYPGYQQRLIQSNAVDFDDLLMHVAVMLRENPELRAELDELYRYILVDEYQDTNLAQYTIVRALSIDHPNLAVTGDPDQSIYAWRGADINNILEFERDYPRVRLVRLEQNYRSTKRILLVADQLISNNIYRKEKSLFTENETGEPARLVLYANGQEEAEDIARQIADCVREGVSAPVILRFSSAPMRYREISNMRCGNTVCRTKWSTELNSISAKKSRMSWPICIWLIIRGTMWLSCASSTHRLAASAKSHCSIYAIMPANIDCRYWTLVGSLPKCQR